MRDLRATTNGQHGIDPCVGDRHRLALTVQTLRAWQRDLLAVGILINVHRQVADRRDAADLHAL